MGSTVFECIAAGGGACERCTGDRRAHAPGISRERTLRSLMRAVGEPLMPKPDTLAVARKALREDGFDRRRIEECVATWVRAWRVCGACGRVPLVPRKCGRCRAEFYCDKDCQAAGWPAHRLNCKAGDAPAGAPSPSSRR